MALRVWIRRIPRSNQIRSASTAAEPPVPPAKKKYIPTSGTYPKGFLAGSAHARVKPANTKYNDVALVISEQPCTAAAVFTRNVFKAAPVTVSDAILQKRSEGFRGVVVNSGFANAVTGSAGTTHAWDMAKAADRCFGDAAADIPQTLVMSTGIIGQQLPIDRITAAIPKAHAALGTGHTDWLNAARAICTTDTFPKLVSRKFTLPSDPNTEYHLAGMTKGAGMIHPNMGTLLGIVCTDAKIAAPDIRTVLRHATDQSFNCISVDGDTSTNDTVAFFANGAATPHPDAPALTFPGNNVGSSVLDLSGLSPDSRAFAQILTSFMTDLAHLVVRDGEGATKFVTVRVRSATSAVAARRAAASIATSALVKTALYGRDANWGRILCAIGYAPGVAAGPLSDIVADSADHVRPARTTVEFVPADGSPALALLVRGEPQDVDEARAKEILEMENLEILVRLDDDGTGKDAEGGFEAKYWTCDFSHEYVTINGDYRT